jgi:ketopantoate reductase
MLKDFVAGRPLELDGIAGPIVRGGEKHSIPVPMTKKLMETISRKIDARRG